MGARLLFLVLGAMLISSPATAGTYGWGTVAAPSRVAGTDLTGARTHCGHGSPVNRPGARLLRRRLGRHRPHRPRMTVSVVMLVVAVLIAVYLLVALLRPERF